MQAIKKFRLHELNGLRPHIKRFGPLLKEAGPETSSTLPKLLPNPFLPRLNPKTGRWAPPKYSLRRQADLIKKAKESNSLHLLPAGPKLAPSKLLAAKLTVAGTVGLAKGIDLQERWARPVAWLGDVKEKAPGATIGSRLYAGRKRMFKGHKWERRLESREKRRKVLMRDMKKRVTSYKAYYHRRRPNPLKPARSTKSPKLPF